MDWKLFKVIAGDYNRQKMLGNEKRVFWREYGQKKNGMMFERDLKDQGN